MKKLNHFNQQGHAHMVDVGAKTPSKRQAIATGTVIMSADTLNVIKSGTNKKGDVLSVARIAGIMASKRTADLIPLCHPLSLTHVDIELTVDEHKSAVHCLATVETHGKTGVEMEALTAVHITLLTIYDMCKAIDRGMTMTNINLLKKTGGKSGNWQRE